MNKYSQTIPIKKAVAGKRIAIDIFWFIHRSKGDLNRIRTMLNDYIESCEKAIFVFDGKVSEERKPELAALREKREEVAKTISVLEEELKKLADDGEDKKKALIKYIEELRTQSWAPKGNYVAMVKKMIEEWWGGDGESCSIVIAPYEADLYFGDLEKQGEIDYIVSNDSDMLALGYKNLIRPCEDVEGEARMYRMDFILKELNMSADDWRNFIDICRAYARSNPSKFDIIVPYSIWRVYYRKGAI